MRSTVLSLNSLVLLCLYGDFVESEISPFTLRQYNQLEFKLNHSTLGQPATLLLCSKEEMMTQLAYGENEVDHILARLALMPEVLKQLAYYEKNQIGIITKFEADYPEALLQRLKKDAPLVLYYCGNFQLLSQDAVAIFGSHHPTTTIKTNTRKVVRKIHDEGYHLMASGHPGCETAAIEQQLKLGGHVILFAANDLEKKRLAYLKYLGHQRMLLVSHRRPDSAYDVVESIVRNSYIYALCVTSFIIHSEWNTGSLWFSAMQNLKQRWSKILAIVDDDFYGNAKLVEAGAIPVTMAKITSEATIENMMEVSKDEIENMNEGEQLSIFAFLTEA